jgi:hypothetical protein
MTFPRASFTVALSGNVAPTSTDPEVGETVTLVTTGATAVTVIAAVPTFPDDVAVIVAEPAATPLTTPLAFTVADAALFVDQVTV